MNDLRQHIAARFAAAAQSYDAHSAVQRHAAARLAGLIATASLPPRARVLEIGCGTGHLTGLLATHLPGARILASDIAPAMVAACHARLPTLDYAVMDGMLPAVAVSGRRPARFHGFDLVCANLAAQWFDDLPAALHRLAALLAPNGVLAASLLGAQTFAEWRAAHARLGLRDGVQRFPEAARCRVAFPADGTLHWHAEKHIDRPASALNFLRSLRGLGADTAAAGHRPLSAAQLRRVLHELDAGDTGAAATYEIFYALWRKPA
jgi:malonyl-CoA O-methyltransferase